MTTPVVTLAELTKALSYLNPTLGGALVGATYNPEAVAKKPRKDLSVLRRKYRHRSLLDGVKGYHIKADEGGEPPATAPEPAPEQTAQPEKPAAEAPKTSKRPRKTPKPPKLPKSTLFGQQTEPSTLFKPIPPKVEKKPESSTAGVQTPQETPTEPPEPETAEHRHTRYEQEANTAGEAEQLREEMATTRRDAPVSRQLSENNEAISREFMADILENPDDPTPSLVYADWLEENGLEARGRDLRWWTQTSQEIAEDIPWSRPDNDTPTPDNPNPIGSQIQEAIEHVVQHDEGLARLGFIELVQQVQHRYPHRWDDITAWPEGWSSGRVRRAVTEALQAAQWYALGMSTTEMMAAARANLDQAYEATRNARPGWLAERAVTTTNVVRGIVAVPGVADPDVRYRMVSRLAGSVGTHGPGPDPDEDTFLAVENAALHIFTVMSSMSLPSTQQKTLRIHYTKRLNQLVYGKAQQHVDSAGRHYCTERDKGRVPCGGSVADISKPEQQEVATTRRGLFKHYAKKIKRAVDRIAVRIGAAYLAPDILDTAEDACKIWYRQTPPIPGIPLSTGQLVVLGSHVLARAAQAIKRIARRHKALDEGLVDGVLTVFQIMHEAIPELGTPPSREFVERMVQGRGETKAPKVPPSPFGQKSLIRYVKADEPLPEQPAPEPPPTAPKPETPAPQQETAKKPKRPKTPKPPKLPKSTLFGQQTEPSGLFKPIKPPKIEKPESSTAGVQEPVTEQPQQPETEKPEATHRRFEREAAQEEQPPQTPPVNPEQRLTVEESFQRDMLEDPTDPTPAMVYADWLEDHGQEQAGQNLRLWTTEGPRLTRSIQWSNPQGWEPDDLYRTALQTAAQVYVDASPAVELLGLSLYINQVLRIFVGGNDSEPFYGALWPSGESAESYNQVMNRIHQITTLRALGVTDVGDQEIESARTFLRELDHVIEKVRDEPDLGGVSAQQGHTAGGTATLQRTEAAQHLLRHATDLAEPEASELDQADLRMVTIADMRDEIASAYDLDETVLLAGAGSLFANLHRVFAPGRAAPGVLPD